MRILITGSSGFVGSHLLESFLKNGDVQLFATKRWRSDMKNVEHIKDKVTWYDMDLNDAHSIERTIKEVSPEIIFHLSAISFVKTSFIYPYQTMQTNTLGCINLLEAVRTYVPGANILLAGSSEEYGAPPKDGKSNWIVPINEETRLQPLSPYGVSKVAQTLLGIQYNKSYGLKTVCTRAFNHTGVRRNENFICAKIVKQGVEIKQGKRKIFVLGNLDARRDFTNVKDMIRAYRLAVEKCNFGEIYVISSGKAYSVREIVDMIAEILNISNKVEIDPSFMRPSDVPILLGDSSKFHKKTGWKARISFEDTLREMVDEELKKEA